MLGGWVTWPPHYPQKRSTKKLEIRKQEREYPTSTGFGVQIKNLDYRKPHNLGYGKANPRNTQFRMPLTLRYQSFSPIETKNTDI